MHARLAVMPRAQLTSKLTALSASRRTPRMKLWMIIGFEDVQLEVPHRAAAVDRVVVAEDLAHEHGERLGLGRVELAGHD